MTTAPPTPRRRQPAPRAHRVAAWVESVLFVLLIHRRIRAMLAQLEALFAAWQAGTLPPPPAPRPHQATAAAAPRARTTHQPRAASAAARPNYVRHPPMSSPDAIPASAAAPARRHSVRKRAPIRALCAPARRFRTPKLPPSLKNARPALAPTHALFITLS